jgi:HPt (histidine-containing phosphotransfer) domain-containing protein
MDFSLEKIADTYGLDSPEAALEAVEQFLLATQVYLANLEEAIEAEDCEKILNEAHKIAVEASIPELHAITNITEQIELLATFGRQTNYMPLFESLREELHTVYEHYLSESELLAR